MAHFQLIDPDNPTALVGQLSKHGSGSFYVKPTSKNTTSLPINGKAIVDILGKKVNISLVHRVKETEDPEPSVPKWSFFKNLYDDYNPLTPVTGDTLKGIQSCYVFATAGNTTYTGNPSNIVTSTTLKISRPFIEDSDARADTRNLLYEFDVDTDEMPLCSFRMFYKAPYTDPNTGDPVVPSDDDTPESNRLRLPCNVAITNTPSWITNVHIQFCIETFRASDPSLSDTTYYDNWSDFRIAWEAARANYTDYSDAQFFCQIVGKIATNSDTAEVRTGSPNTIAIQEIAGDESKVWGAKPLYLYIGQLGGYKRIRLYYKKAESNEVTVPGSGGTYPVTAQSPGSAQIDNSNHKLWFSGSPCSVLTDDQGDDIITIVTYPSRGAITGKGVRNDRNQDHRTLSYTDTSKNRTEYYYIGHPFFLGFVEETNLYKESVGINLFDNRNSRDFWHSLYFTGVDAKCTYDPEWQNVGEMPHLHQSGDPFSINNVGYTILFPWAVKSGNSWKSLSEIPTSYDNGGLVNNDHRILAIDWIAKAAGDPALGYDNLKSTSDIRYGGGVSIESGLEAGGGVLGRDKSNGEGWYYNPNAVPTGSGKDRLHNYLEYVAQQWDNNITAFGSPAELRSVKEILFVPMFVTPRKVCSNDPINASNRNAMCYGSSLIPYDYRKHEGYAPLIAIFPPYIEEYYQQ